MGLETMLFIPLLVIVIAIVVWVKKTDRKDGQGRG
jgi:hypothetical protein